MRGLVILLLLCLPAATKAERACPQPVWTQDLATGYGFRSFGEEWLGDVPHPQGWIESRGIIFLSPEFIALYQVLPGDESPQLATRDADGKLGTLVLRIQIIAAADGSPVKLLRLTTSSGVNRPSSSKREPHIPFESVLPTHDGKFLVRTKGMLHLFSSDFKEIMSKALPRSGTDSHDYWDFSVSSDGDRIYAEHHENTGYSDKEPFKLTRYLMDADTLQVLRSWDYRERPWGPPWEPPYRISGEGKHRRVVSAGDELLLNISLSRGESLGPTALTKSLFLGEIYQHHADPFDFGRCDKPVRLTADDLRTKSEKCSIPITEKAGPCGSGFLFSASSAGDVAVIQGTELSLYRP